MATVCDTALGMDGDTDDDAKVPDKGRSRMLLQLETAEEEDWMTLTLFLLGNYIISLIMAI